MASLDRWQKFPGPKFSLLRCRPGSWKPSRCTPIAAEMIFVATEKKSFSNARAEVTKTNIELLRKSQTGFKLKLGKYGATKSDELSESSKIIDKDVPDYFGFKDIIEKNKP